MKCDYCEYYEYHVPTWQNPTHEEYCRIYGDFSEIPECLRFSLSKYGKRKIKNNRIKKLERIIK